MSPIVQSWLLTYPNLRKISKLVADAAECGLVELAPDLARAIAASVRRQSIDRDCARHRPGFHQRNARAMARCMLAPRIQIDGDVAVFEGILGRGVTISQGASHALLHLRTPLPESLVTALPGRRLAEIIDAPVLRRGQYRITRAIQDATGCYIDFGVPTRPLSTMDLARRAPRDQSSGTPAGVRYLRRI